MKELARAEVRPIGSSIATINIGGVGTLTAERHQWIGQSLITSTLDNHFRITYGVGDILYHEPTRGIKIINNTTNEKWTLLITLQSHFVSHGYVLGGVGDLVIYHYDGTYTPPGDIDPSTFNVIGRSGALEGFNSQTGVFEDIYPTAQALLEIAPGEEEIFIPMICTAGDPYPNQIAFSWSGTAAIPHTTINIELVEKEIV